MIQFLDRTFNLLLNAAGFSGLSDPHQILIAVVIGTATVLWNSSLVPRWALMAFFSLMTLAVFVALYALLFGLRPTCIYVYEQSKPVFADSDTRKLSWSEVRNLDCATLWVARNELYYRSNYCFFTPIGYAYFDNDARCDPAIENPQTAVAAENAKLFRLMETRKGCPNPIASCRQLGGVKASRLRLNRPTAKEE
jgi:hypothetical protein